jgi:hypothetical protein
MARKKKTKLNSAAVRIGSTVGKAHRQTRNIVKRAQLARKEVREELIELSKMADRLSRDLKKTNKRLRRALG